MNVTQQMILDACDAQEPGWRVFDASLFWSVQRGLKAALRDSSPALEPPDA